MFGTLFERSLDPDKRAQIGAHYTSREDIMLVIEPVIVRPLRKAYEEMQEAIEARFERRAYATTAATKKKADSASPNSCGLSGSACLRPRLDPACGSGNFLYVAIQQLLELEKELILYARARSSARAGSSPRSAHAGSRASRSTYAAGGAGGHLDRLPSVDARQRLQRAATPSSNRSRPSRTATRS